VNLVNIPLTTASNLITLIALGNISIILKWSNVFSWVLEVVDKNNTIIVDTMEHMNSLNRRLGSIATNSIVKLLRKN
jgi:hypothetical protein